MAVSSNAALLLGSRHASYTNVQSGGTASIEKYVVLERMKSVVHARKVIT